MGFGRNTFKGDAATQAVQLGGINRLRQDRNRAYLLNIALIFAVLGLALAVAALANIRTVIPVVSVLDANGHVVKQTIVSRETITGQESFVQATVKDFIEYCNTFDPDPYWRQHFADLCRLHSTEKVAAQYDWETAAANADNPYYAIIAQHARRYPKIIGIRRLPGNDAFQVEFQSVTEKIGEAPKIEYYVALVQYIFTYKPLAIENRWENSLGFAATAYSKNQKLSEQ